MTTQEKIDELKSIAKRINDCRLASASNMLTYTNDAIRLMRDFPPFADTHQQQLFDVELNYTIKYQGYLNQTASGWSKLTKPKKTTADQFTGYRLRLVTYVEKAAEILESNV